MYCPDFSGRLGATGQHPGQLEEPQDHSNDLIYSTEAPPPPRIWGADSLLPKAFSFMLGLPATPLPLVLPKHTLYSHRKERRLCRYGVHCGSTMPPSSSEHQALPELCSVSQVKLWAPGLLFTSLRATTSPSGLSIPPTPPNSSTLGLTAASGRPSRFPKLFSQPRRTSAKGSGVVLGDTLGDVGLPGLSYLGTCTASWLERCLPD